MFRRREKQEPPPLRVFTLAQEKLLNCPVDGCHQDANPENAVSTGVLGLGKAWVYLCDRHANERKATLEQYIRDKRAKKAGKE